VEWLSWVPLLVLIIALGVFPGLVFGMTDEAVRSLSALIGA
jgi:NADH-quinone oxidoreductase subunit M